MSSGITAQASRDALREGVDAASRFDGAKAPAHATNGTHLITRTLPHSIEAEEALLSTCFLDGADMVARCLESKIGVHSFYGTNNGIIFERLVDLYNRKVPIDVAIVAEELKTHRQIDQVGGYPFLTQISDKVPTTSQAAYFIAKVHEQALLREIIRSATGTVEDAYGFTTGIEEFCDDQLGRLVALLGPSAGAGGTLLARALAIEVDPVHPPADDRPIFYIGDKLSSTTSNLTALAGRAKTAKTAVIGAMTAACIVADGLSADSNADTLGIRSSSPGGRAVVVLDTEQSPAHSSTNLRRTLARVGLTPEQKPKWIRVFPLAGWSAKELTAVLPVLLKAASKAHGGLHAVFLDGGADFARDVNSSEEASGLCATWHALAIAHACVIVVIIHTNESRQSDDIARGWLGKQLRRKAESNLTLKRDRDVIVLFGEDGQRHAPIFERDGPRFSWSHQYNMHMSCDASADPKLMAKREKLRDVTDAVFAQANKEAMCYSDLIKAIVATTGVSSDHAGTRLTELRKTGLIAKDLIGLWRRTGGQG